MSKINASSFFAKGTQYIASQSLRFDDGDSPYFSFTFGTPTNQIKWTMSFWCKRGEIGREHAIYGATSGGGETFFTAFYPDDIETYISTGRNHVTNAVFRDPSAWYHIVQVFDSANATADDRFITYVNGVRQTTSTNSVALNDTTGWNTSGVTGYFGKNYGAWFGDSRDYFDGYLANVCFIDGQALTPTSFGEYDDTLWKPKSDADITSLTFGTNGFYLPFKQTTEAEGFSTVTYTGNGGTQSIEGVGFEPDLVWMKERTNTNSHQLVDSVRGVQKGIFSDLTAAEYTYTNHLSSFDSSGFTLGLNPNVNGSGKNYVAWCWDAGSGSAASNTDGSITSSVKANTAKGFSIISFVGNATAGATVGHGLSSTPEMVISKNRNVVNNWLVYHKDLDASNPEQKRIFLNLTNAVSDSTTPWNDTAPSSSVLTLGTSGYTNGSSDNMIMYAFHSVSGYSSIGSYSGTGVAGNSITGLGFKPAFVMAKRTDSAGNWVMFDNTRSPVNTADNVVSADLSDREYTSADGVGGIDFDSDGFTLQDTHYTRNASGGTYIYMAFADTRDATFFGDTSGNSNNWTPNALKNTDVVPDSPVTGGNFAVFNSLVNVTGDSFSEGNLKVTTGSSAYGPAISSFAVSSGKWYCEFLTTASSGDQRVGGVRVSTNLTTTYDLGNSGSFAYRQNDGQKKIDGTQTAYGATWAADDIIGMALNLDDDEVTFYKNNSSQGTFSITTGEYFLATSDGDSGAGMGAFANFGQDSSFAGNKTPQGNTDNNGVGDFYYAPPSGFLALTTGNLPAATITAPDEYFNTLLWTGDGTSSRSLTGVNFQPDLVWGKDRNVGYQHSLQDVVRGTGAGGKLYSSLTEAEGGANSVYGHITSFDSDGFSVATGTGGAQHVNQNTVTYVAWNWLAGNGTVSNTDGTITSTVSANQTAGFSIVNYTGDGGTGETSVGHGLSQTPELIIHKNRDSTGSWPVTYTVVDGSNDFMYLNSTAAAGNATQTLPTSSVFYIQSSAAQRNSGQNYIQYCFHSVEGYSKIGSYTGNGSSDGTFVHCGFRPAWVLIRLYDSGGTNWLIYDNKRDPYNVTDEALLPNSSSAAGGSANAMDITSNGFKFRTSAGSVNGNGYNYIFMAFAEAPFKSANAR